MTTETCEICEEREATDQFGSLEVCSSKECRSQLVKCLNGKECRGAMLYSSEMLEKGETCDACRELE